MKKFVCRSVSIIALLAGLAANAWALSRPLAEEDSTKFGGAETTKLVRSYKGPSDTQISTWVYEFALPQKNGVSIHLGFPDNADLVITVSPASKEIKRENGHWILKPDSADTAVTVTASGSNQRFKDGAIKYTIKQGNNVENSVAIGPELLFKPAFIRPVFGAGLGFLTDDLVEFSDSDTGQYLLVKNDSPNRPALLAGVLFNVQSFTQKLKFDHHKHDISEFNGFESDTIKAAPNNADSSKKTSNKPATGKDGSSKHEQDKIVDSKHFHRSISCQCNRSSHLIKSAFNHLLLPLRMMDDILFSVEFAEEGAKGIDGISVGASMRLTDEISFVVGYSRRKGKELSPGFKNKAKAVIAQYLNTSDSTIYKPFKDYDPENEGKHQNMLDGFPLTYPRTKDSIFPGKPTITSYNSSINIGFVFSVNLQSLFTQPK